MVRMMVAQNTETAETREGVCNQPVQSIGLQKEITELEARLFLPTMCDYPENDS